MGFLMGFDGLLMGIKNGDLLPGRLRSAGRSGWPSLSRQVYYAPERLTYIFQCFVDARTRSMESSWQLHDKYENT